MAPSKGAADTRKPACVAALQHDCVQGLNGAGAPADVDVGKPAAPDDAGVVEVGCEMGVVLIAQREIEKMSGELGFKFGED